jgi:putative hemolysin
MEIGRTCVDPNFRSGAVIGLLWSKIGQYMNQHKIDQLMGCASISILDGGARAFAVVKHLRDKHFSPEPLRVIPKISLPHFDVSIEGKEHVPALLKTYLRMGAKVCGEAYLDREFNVADVLILLAKKDIAPRYLRHFS